jgi:phospholipid/cholesterol/gamma-HCH transport system substrate-binding protein
MKRNIIETLIGALVLLVAVGAIFFAYSNAGMKVNASSYKIFAQFERIDGLTLGSDVRVGGVKVGIVSQQTLDPKTYLARVEMSINQQVKLPKDSSAQIVSDGLLGSKYVAIIPGAEDAMLAANEEITFTQSSVNLETLIGKMMFNGAEGKEDKQAQ